MNRLKKSRLISEFLVLFPKSMYSRVLLDLGLVASGGFKRGAVENGTSSKLEELVDENDRDGPPDDNLPLIPDKGSDLEDGSDGRDVENDKVKGKGENDSSNEKGVVPWGH